MSREGEGESGRGKFLPLPATLKPVNEIDAQFKFILFLCQVGPNNVLVVLYVILF